MKINIESQTNYPTAFENGKIFLSVDNSISDAFNVKIGNMPITYNRGTTVIKPTNGWGAFMEEFGGVDSYKEIHLDTRAQYTVDVQGYIDGLTINRITAGRIINSYAGGTIPQPSK